MITGRFRLLKATLAITAVNGHHEALTIPTGALLDLNGKTFNGHRLMEVTVDGKAVLMFTEDLKAATVPA